MFPGPLISWPELLAFGHFSSHMLLAMSSPHLAGLCHPPWCVIFLLGLWPFSFNVPFPLILSCRMCRFDQSSSGHLQSLWEDGLPLLYRWTGSESLLFLFLFFYTNPYPENLWYLELLFSSGTTLLCVTSRHVDSSWFHLLYLFFKQGDQLGQRWSPAEKKKNPTKFPQAIEAICSVSLLFGK